MSVSDGHLGEPTLPPGRALNSGQAPHRYTPENMIRSLLAPLLSCMNTPDTLFPELTRHVDLTRRRNQNEDSAPR